MPALAAVPVGVLAVAAGALAWREEGSFAARDWLSYAVLAAVLLAVALLSGVAPKPSRLAVGAIGGLLGLATWVAASATWSPVPSLARDEALLAVLYAVVLAVPLATLRSESERVIATALVVAALSALALLTALELGSSPDPIGLYEDRRLNFPISYSNGQAAAFLICFWPAICLAARRTAHPLGRGLALGGATALLAGWLLTQSKGGGLALAVSAVVVFAASRHRLRLLGPTLLSGGVAALGVVPLTAPFRASGDEALADSIRRAGTVALVLAAGAAVLGLVYALADRRIDISPRARRVAGAAALAALVVGVVGGIATFVVTVDRPGPYLEARWESFKRYPERETGSTHFSTLGSNRYDFWRVALGEFERHPIAGIGGRGFGSAYLERGRSGETPQNAHSLPLDVLSETGAIGFVLLCAAIGLALAAVARRSRRTLLGAGLLGAGAYWAAHTLVDWIWTLPAVGIPLFLLLGIGAAGVDRAPAGRGALAAGVAAVLLACLVFAPPWLSARLTNRAIREPSTAETTLDWARRLDPLSTSPLLAEATLARPPSDIPPLERAVAKEPRNAELHYLLGRAYLEADRRPEARRELRIARRLYPGSRLIRNALRRAA